MEIKITRTLEDMRELLYTPDATGNEICYWVFSGLNHIRWENMSVVIPGLYGNEYPKTYGHYHTLSNDIETYRLINGQGVFLFQKKHQENGQLIQNVVDEVIIVGCKPGDEININPLYAHSWSNTGDLPLVTFDTWRSGHSPHDYEPIKNMHGLAYYMTSNNGVIKPVPNLNYKNLPEPKWMTAKEFNDYTAA